MTTDARPKPIRDRLRAKLVAEVVAGGATSVQAEAAVAELLDDRPILEWLARFDWAEIVQLVLKIIALL